jgi:hypothetical protein
MPVQDIVALVDVDAYLVDIWTEPDAFTDPENESPPLGDKFADVTYYVPLRDAVLISEPDDVTRDLLVPRAGRDEWEVWVFAKEGAAAYRSFAALLRNVLARPDARPRPELADEYAAAVEHGQWHRLRELVELGDPRAETLALARLLDPELDDHDKHGWTLPFGRLADPRFVPALLRAYEQATTEGLRLELLGGLTACHDPRIDDTLRAIVSGPDNLVRRWAASQHDGVARLEKAGWQYSIGVRVIKPVRAAVDAIREDAWQAIADYPDGGEAQIAETVYGGRRLIVHTLASVFNRVFSPIPKSRHRGDSGKEKARL